MLHKLCNIIIGGNRHAKIIPDNDIDSAYEDVYGYDDDEYYDEYYDDEYYDDEYKDEGNQLVEVPFILHLFDALYSWARR
jgi:hypothetical protein